MGNFFGGFNRCLIACRSRSLRDSWSEKGVLWGNRWRDVSQSSSPGGFPFRDPRTLRLRGPSLKCERSFYFLGNFPKRLPDIRSLNELKGGKKTTVDKNNEGGKWATKEEVVEGLLGKRYFCHPLIRLLSDFFFVSPFLFHRFWGLLWFRGHQAQY